MVQTKYCVICNFIQKLLAINYEMYHQNSCLLPTWISFFRHRILFQDSKKIPKWLIIIYYYNSFNYLGLANYAIKLLSYQLTIFLVIVLDISRDLSMSIL